MTEIHVVAANPAGNVTLFVKDQIPAHDRGYIARQLLGNPLWKAEQVGFMTEPVYGGQARLEMMGGEFCGNALRSFGYYTAMQLNCCEKGSVLVEISGADRAFTVDFDLNIGTAYTEMPIPNKIEMLQLSDGREVPLVIMDGISHVIIQGPECQKEKTEELLNQVCVQKNPEAVGILYIDGLEMKPVVYVRDTDSIVYESSCGSGSIAYAYLKLRRKI